MVLTMESMSFVVARPKTDLNNSPKNANMALLLLVFIGLDKKCCMFFRVWAMLRSMLNRSASRSPACCRSLASLLSLGPRVRNCSCFIVFLMGGFGAGGFGML